MYWFKKKKTKSNLLGAGVMAELLTALAALSEDLGLVPNKHMLLTTICNSGHRIPLPVSGATKHAHGT